MPVCGRDPGLGGDLPAGCVFAVGSGRGRDSGKKRRGGGRAAAYRGRDAGGIPCGAGLASKDRGAKEQPDQEGECGGTDRGCHGRGIQKDRDAGFSE